MTDVEVSALRKRMQAIQCCASLLHQSSFPARACVDVVTAMEFLEAEFQAGQKELDAGVIAPDVEAQMAHVEAPAPVSADA